MILEQNNAEISDIPRKYFNASLNVTTQTYFSRTPSFLTDLVKVTMVLKCFSKRLHGSPCLAFYRVLMGLDMLGRFSAILIKCGVGVGANSPSLFASYIKQDPAEKGPYQTPKRTFSTENGTIGYRKVRLFFYFFFLISA